MVWGRRAFWGLAGILGLGVAGFGGAKLFPETTADYMIAGVELSAGLKAGVVETEIGPLHYLEAGSGEPVLFLHGIYARKEHWIDVSRAISGAYRVILLDLPGFGENAVLGEGAYDFNAQARNFRIAVDALELERFHIAANSMSAQIAGMFAAETPERVASLAFIGSPVGVASPVRSEMELALAEGNIPLLVETPEDFFERMPWLFPKTPFMPAPVLETWAAEEAALAENNRRIWAEVSASEGAPLEELAPDLTMPSLIVWCDEDRIFHPSGGPVLEDALGDGRLVALKGCGHVPMLDKPRKVGEVYLEFLKGL